MLLLVQLLTQQGEPPTVAAYAMLASKSLIFVTSGQVASRLELLGVDVCLVDQSPINLHAFAQQGFHTVTGNASGPQVLRRAQAASCDLVVGCVPDDEATTQIVRALRSLNSTAAVVVRVRYLGNIDRAIKAGANAVISEEAEASNALLSWCVRFVRPTAA
jgi:CPA2 family monovalent cation:H+ antiporter-2